MSSKENVKKEREVTHSYSSAKLWQPRAIEVLVGDPGPLFIDGNAVGHLDAWDRVYFQYYGQEIVSFRIQKPKPEEAFETPGVVFS